MSPLADDLLTVRRHPERGTQDRTVIDAILTEGVVCHLGYLRDTADGVVPVVIPTLYARDGDDLILHGSAASRALRTGAEGLPVCATVTLLDGLVLARSVFHHSANYRSVIVHGRARLVEDPADKVRALELLTEHVAPGRWAEARLPDDSELRATAVLRLPLERAVAKVRAGGVGDPEDDLEVAAWAGVVPVWTVVGAPEPAEGLAPGLATPPWAGGDAEVLPLADRHGAGR